jgi:hypothetical protein
VTTPSALMVAHGSDCDGGMALQVMLVLPTSCGGAAAGGVIAAPGVTAEGPVWVDEHGELAWAPASQLDWLRLVCQERVVAGWPFPAGPGRLPGCRRGRSRCRW